MTAHKNVILAVTRTDGTVFGVAAREPDAMEVGKHLVHTFDQYTSARIEDANRVPSYVIDKDIPDWTVCEPVTQG
jgi:hypothetical protein